MGYATFRQGPAFKFGSSVWLREMQRMSNQLAKASPIGTVGSLVVTPLVRGAIFTRMPYPQDNERVILKFVTNFIIF